MKCHPICFPLAYSLLCWGLGIAAAWTGNIGFLIALLALLLGFFAYLIHLSTCCPK